jgi:hypothetical protein
LSFYTEGAENSFNSLGEARPPFLPMVDIVQGVLNQQGLKKEDLDREIAINFVRCMASIEKVPRFDQVSFINETPYEGLSPIQALEEFNEQDWSLFNDLSPIEKDRFLFFRGANYMWDWTLMLTEDSTWVNRHQPKKLKDFAKDHFPLLQKFLANLPFEYLGRIMVLGTSPLQKVYRHIDTSEDEFPIDNIIISFQPLHRCKEMWVEDNKGRRSRPPPEGYCLDDSFPHELIPKPFFTYSVRIEGKFLPGVRQTALKQFAEQYFQK